MTRPQSTGIAGGVALALLSVLVACAPRSPEERVAALRARYTATFNGFIVKETPLVEEAELMAGEGVGDDEEFEPAPMPMSQGLLFDLLVQHDADERLPGITVDVVQVDAAKVEKARWRVWVETAELAKATHKQISYEVEDADYEEGDGFYAEIVDVPPGDRAAYREFSESGG